MFYVPVAISISAFEGSRTRHSLFRVSEQARQPEHQIGHQNQGQQGLEHTLAASDGRLTEDI